MKEPKELLLEMAQREGDEPDWLNGRKIEVADVAKAMHCSLQILYTFAQEGSCPFISAAKPEDNKTVSYLVWPGKAEEYIGRERLMKAMREREAAI